MRASAADFAMTLRGWCRDQGHEFVEGDGQFARGLCAAPRRRDVGEGPNAATFRRAGESAVYAAPPADWDSPRAAPRSRRAGRPLLPLQPKERVWAERRPKLYAQAVAAQWNPQTAIDWDERVASRMRVGAGRRAGDDLPDRERERGAACRRASSRKSIRISGKSCNCSPCRSPTRRATSKSSPRAPRCGAERWGCPR